MADASPIERLTAGHPDARSADVVDDHVERLRDLFPEAFIEGRIDFDVLRQLLGDAVEDGDERYGLNWRGKRAARRLALTPSTGTLRPSPDESVDWDTTQNLMIEGDNLEVLKLLRKSYAGKVKLIYIDPPYNTGSDFVYPDDFQDSIQHYLEMTGQVGDGGVRMTSNTEASGRFHTDWLNMLYPRLLLARDLLSPDGVLLVSIDDHEVDNLRLVCADLFGHTNFLIQLVWKSKSGGANDSQHFAVDHEYVLGFAKSLADFELRLDPQAEVTTSYNRRDERGEYALDRLDKQSIRYSSSLDYEIRGPDGTKYRPSHKDPNNPNATWRWGKDTVSRRYEELVFENGYVYTKNYKSDGATPRSLLVDERFGRTRTGKTEVRSLMGAEVFDNPKPTKLVAHLIRIVTQPDDIVMDFFGGSGTTAHATWLMNLEDGGRRRSVTVQLPEPLDPNNKEQAAAAKFCESLGVVPRLSELTKERLRRAGANIREEHPMFSGDLGFRVFKLDSSNIREWDPQPEDLEATLDAAVENLKTDRTEQDILYELLLKRGIELTVPIETRTIAGKPVHSIGAGTLFTCLDERIERADAEPLALGIVAWRDELDPAGDVRVVFRDSAFVDDVAKTNLAEILKQHGLADVKSI